MERRGFVTEDKSIRKKELDDFWNISELSPSSKRSFGRPTSTEPVEIQSASTQVKHFREENSTVIRRYIPPHSSDIKLDRKNDFTKTEDYVPNSSLIHHVTIKKYKTSYNYYSGFLKNAIDYKNVRGEFCEYVPFFSYVPQYDQMNDQQLSYYLWFRESVNEGRFIKTDYGYLFLYIYELINLGARLDVKRTQNILMSIWNEYSEEFPAITTKLADWICDFSLLHRLTPPILNRSKIIQKVYSLKEFYIDLPKNDIKSCANTLMAYCSSYDYRESKFYTEPNKELFDRHIPEVLSAAIRYYSTDGKILSGLELTDSTLSRDAYVGALCTAEQKFRIEVSYCSFSRSNELRFLIGDIIKYSENKLRAHIGIKSKMTVYSITSEMRTLIDEYFTEALPARLRKKATPERHEYDVLYEVPKKPLSLSDAAKIEETSWTTTAELIDAFDADEYTEEEPIREDIRSVNDTVSEPKDVACDDVFKKYRDVIIAIINGNNMAIDTFARAEGKMPDGVVDEINELAYEHIGDLLIEDDGMGSYHVIEDYKNLFE